MKFKISAGWVLELFGVYKWLDRVLHVPSDVLPAAAAMAGVTPDQWRAVEKVQQQIVKQGIDAKTG